MQATLDNFFKRTPVTKKTAETRKSPKFKKRKALVISSDEDDEVAASPQVTKSHGFKKTRTEPEQKTPPKEMTKKPTLSKLKTPTKIDKLKRVDPTALFGGETVRVAAKKPPKPKDKALLELEDDEIDQSLMEIDVDESPLKAKVNDSNDKLEKRIISPHKTTKSPATTPQKVQESPRKKLTVSPADKEIEKTAKKIKTSPVKHDQVIFCLNDQQTPTAAKKKRSQKLEHTPITTPKLEKQAKSKPKVKEQEHDNADMNSSVLSDEERFQRRRAAYQNFVNRPSCLNHGSKEVPKGKPNCLAGLSFIVTGVLDSLERPECEAIIKEYGGKVMSTVGKRLHYLIAGEQAGTSKLEKAEQNNITVLSEDEFFDLIRKKSDGESQTVADVIVEEKSKKSSPKQKDMKKDTERIKKERLETTPEKKPKLEKVPVKIEHEEKKTVQDVKIISITEVAIDVDAQDDTLAWVDKHKPKSVKDIIGQQGPASNVAKLTNWLSKWYTNHDGKKKLLKPSPWAKNDDGSYYKAALLSGPPGVGKTTTANLVCKELGFDIVEFNASDTRSKRLLKEEVSELLSNKSLYGYFHGKAQAVTKKHVLIMDEVDGMAGNEDRGGIQELIALIKDSSVPIICMCNDRNHQKMRSLVNYCYDLRFNKPQLKPIKGYIMGICCKENFKLDPNKVEEIITATNNDIRQTINHISLLSAGKKLEVKSKDANNGTAEQTAQKDLKIGPWEVVRKVFSADEHKHMSFYDKCDLFFHDYSLSPLFVQQNYLQVSPVGPKSEVMQKVALTADALSLGDLVDKRIRTNSAWTLLPTQAVFSSVMPGEYMSGHFTGQINFPGWLGKNSRANKRNRLAQEIHDHTRLRTSGSRQSIRLDYAPYLLANIVRPLKERGVEGVEESLNVLKEYHLLREDIESLIELSTWPGRKGPMDGVDGRVKAALTRAYNKEVLAYSYSAMAGVKKKRAEAVDDMSMADIEGEDGETVALDSDEEKDDDLENDGLIKAKKKLAGTANTSATSSKGKAATSRKPSTASGVKAKAATSKAKK